MAMPSSFGDSVPGDDSTGFDDLEREFVRRFFPSFDWVRFEAPSPRRALPVPLRRARVGLVVTAGAHLPGEAAFSLDGEVRFLSAGAGALELSHPGYDTPGGRRPTPMSSCPYGRCAASCRPAWWARSPPR